MRLLSYSVGNRASVGVEVEGRVVDLPRGYATLPESARPEKGIQPPGDMMSFLEAGDPAVAGARAVARYYGQALRAGATGGNPWPDGVVYSRDEVKVLAPIQGRPKIFCLGLNYRDHALEAGKGLPKAPIIFSKMHTAITGPGDPIVLPRPEISREVDYEAEFAFVIGRRGRHVPRSQAMDYVAGYTILDDVSARDIQFSESQWLRAKSFDTFAPTGPYLVLKEGIPDPHALDVRLWLNGRLMQSSNTRQLIFGVDYLVSYLSEVFTLEPGDIVSTGTPSGVGYFREPKELLKPGDVVRIEITGLGALENPVTAES